MHTVTDDVELLRRVVLRVHGAVHDVDVPDDRDDVLLLDQLLREGGHELGVDRVDVDDVVDRAAEEAAVVVDAVEVGPRVVGDLVPVDTDGDRDDRADVDRLACRLLARAHAADALLRRGRPRSDGRCRRAGARAERDRGRRYERRGQYKGQRYVPTLHPFLLFHRPRPRSLNRSERGVRGMTGDMPTSGIFLHRRRLCKTAFEIFERRAPLPNRSTPRDWLQNAMRDGV